MIDGNAILPMVAAFIFAFMYYIEKPISSVEKEGKEKKKGLASFTQAVARQIYLICVIGLILFSFGNAVTIQSTTTNSITGTTTYNYAPDSAYAILGLPLLAILILVIFTIIFKFVDAWFF